MMKTSHLDEHQTTELRQTVVVTRQKFIAEFEDVDESFIQNTSIEGFLDFIERQRLTHMPHRGSHWDNVLKWSEYFALQISGYAAAVEAFLPECKAAAQLIWTALESLLQVSLLYCTLIPTNRIKLGPDNAYALETTLGTFYRLGLYLSSLMREGTLLSANDRIRNEVGMAFSTLLILVRQVSLYYSSKLGRADQEASFDFNALFGGQTAAFHQRRHHITDALWEYSLGEEGALDVRAIRKWLGPGDAGLQKLLSENGSNHGGRTEYTCEWFQSHLLSFSRSNNNTLAIHGPTGCGKSVLFSWMIERLQRPLGKKVYATLSCTLGEL